MWFLVGLFIALAILFLAAAVYYRRNARRYAAEVQTAREIALTDSLTGVLNRRGFVEAAERELDRARRYDHPLGFAFVDVRGLKGVNDAWGHGAGDRLLKDVARLLKESSRSHDLVGRIGGDELALLLAEQSAAGVAAVGRRLKAEIPARREELGVGADWDLTVGISIYPGDGQTIAELLGAADRRLYMQRGIKLHSPDPLPPGQRALQTVDRGHRCGIDSPQDGEVDRHQVAEHHERQKSLGGG
jgi:diguanylate cyclase (GGDEF)-like protein